jgi:hypothetical protein
MPGVTINNYTSAQPQVSRSNNGDVTITLKRPLMPRSGTRLRPAPAGASC